MTKVTKRNHRSERGDFVTFVIGFGKCEVRLLRQCGRWFRVSHHGRQFPEPGLVGSEHIAEMELRFAVLENPRKQFLRMLDLFRLLHDPESGEHVANQQLPQP
jgi:hypothetical protein